MKDNIEIVYDEISEFKSFLTCEIVISEETHKSLGPMSETMAYGAILQSIYAVMFQNYGAERAEQLIEGTRSALLAATEGETKEFLDGVSKAQDANKG